MPALVVKFGDYPLHHGGVGAIRSLGRLGVPVYAITEDRHTPAAHSRYLRRAFVWPTTGTEEPSRLVAGLLRIGARIGRPAVLLPTDEEAAVLLAEYRTELSGRFLLPPVDPALPRSLASKQGLYEACRAHGVDTPETSFPESPADVAEFARHARFPVIVKNREAFVRRSRPAVAGTTRVTSAQGLRTLARAWGEHPGVILQEYLPRESAEDWIVHGYFDEESRPLALFTGVKVRSWPPHAGMTARAYVVDNPELAALAQDFVKQLGFAGIVDLDLRFDRRDGRYKLLDFNPRAGAQFRLFENTAGVDVVRAQHLHLTGRPVPPGASRPGRRYVVENIDLPALLAYHRSGYTTPHAPRRARGTELAWFAADDPAPFATMLARSLRPALRHGHALWRARHLGRG
ncbi:ATP-grasp domain-containing protein [Streptomyces sp. SID11385]|uniref:ATP-grasp domain-containing protein n=1 Tax=Streptomyces sp. SID11385 TaxID=2706031 RepID=UPI0013CBC94E|nr:ATP-grasp domain-containing protein [Streptomyces sp. SID11385]